jgi:HK97 family phage major capsid protein
VPRELAGVFARADHATFRAAERRLREKGSPPVTFTATTINSDGAWRPDGYAFSAADVIPDALVVQCSTLSGVIVGDEPVVRVAWIDDAAADFAAEGSTIPEAEPDLAEVLVATGKVSQLVRLSREQWTQPQTASQLALSVARAVTRRANVAFVQQVAPTAPALGPSTGLLHTAGIIDGGDVEDNLDVLIDLVATLQHNLSNPSHILLSPSGWAAFQKLKVGGTSTNQSLLGSGTEDATTMLLSLPVIVDIAMPDATGLVIDKNAIASAYGPVNVSTSEHTYFTSDSIAVRCTFRLGQNVVRPNRIGKFTIGAGGS